MHTHFVRFILIWTFRACVGQCFGNALGMLWIHYEHVSWPKLLVHIQSIGDQPTNINLNMLNASSCQCTDKSICRLMFLYTYTRHMNMCRQIHKYRTAADTFIYIPILCIELHLGPAVLISDNWSSPMQPLRIRRRQQTPKSSNHSLYLIKQFNSSYA